MSIESDYTNNPDDFEIINDAGFVYQRKKRPRVDPTASSPPPNPAADRNLHRALKKRALLNVKKRFLKEKSHWELLSNILQETERAAQTHNVAREEVSPLPSVEDRPGSSSARTRSVVDELLSQVEAQEAMIEKVSTLCDVAETLCRAEEERFSQQFTDLPIWDPSPQELMAALGNNNEET